MSAAWLDLLADLARLDHVERHTLAGLDDAEMVELVATVTGHDEASAHELSVVIRRLTGGNAFFATELLRDLDGRGHLVSVDGKLELVADLDAVGLPAEVGDVIHHRVASLGAGIESVLTAAAVASVGESDFTVGSIEPLIEHVDLLDGLERAGRANLLVEVGPDTWRFVHALVPTTLYRAASQTRRARLHRELAVALERADKPSPASIARHWSLASGVDAAASAARWFVQAARDATAHLAPAEAVERFRAALEQDGRAGSSRFDAGEHLAVRIELGAALRRAGDPSSSDVLTAAAADAQSQHRADLMGRALVADTRGFWNSIGRHDDARVTMIETALQLLPDADSDVRARLLASLASELLFHARREARFELADEALAMAVRLGDDASTFDISLQRVLATSSADRVDAHWAGSAELGALADRIGDPHRKVLAIMARYFVGLQAGYVAEAAPATADASDLAVELGQPMLMWLTGALRAGLLQFQGKLDDAELTALEAFGHGQVAGEDDAFVWFSGQLAATRLQQDRLAEIIDLIADFVAANSELPAWHAVLAVAMCELKRFDEPRAAFEVLSADHFASVPNDQLRTATLCLAAEACRHVGRHAEAASLYELLAPVAGHHGSMAVFSTGSVQRPLGVLSTMLGDHDRAEAHLRTAIDETPPPAPCSGQPPRQRTSRRCTSSAGTAHPPPPPSNRPRQTRTRSASRASPGSATGCVTSFTTPKLCPTTCDLKP